MSTITGHFTMLKMVTAVPSTPKILPTSEASGPLTTMAMALTATSRRRTSVIPTCSGRSFQNGRPSSVS